MSKVNKRYSFVNQPITPMLKHLKSKHESINKCSEEILIEYINSLKDGKEIMKNLWQTLGYTTWKACKSKINHEICVAFFHLCKINN